MTEKSILEQALLQVQTLEEAVKQNAKGILASTMKQELNELLKESEEEEDELTPEMGSDSDEPNEEVTNDMSEQPETDDEDEEGMEDSENVDDLDNDDPSKDIESMDSDFDDESEDEEMNFDEPSFDDVDTDDEDVMDMTGASDDEVLKIFKSMKPEDGIVVKKDGDNVNLDLGDDEYIIKLDGNDEVEMSEEEWGDDSQDDSELEEETIYEIELDEEEDEEIEMSEEEESDFDEEIEIEATEAARTYGNDVRTPANQGKKYKAGRHEMNEEVETLKKQNSEYKKALVLFKEKLNEVAVFNANLAYATRLFTEHSTTKQEKLNILKRFDSISTMNEAKNLFNTIKTELGTKTTVTESVVDKISNTPSSSSSQEVLSESKAYENPQFKRMKDLMGKMK
jgi:hypothetical protein